MDPAYARVVIMCAPPGAGKSTYIRNNYPKASVVSADHFFEDHEGKYVFDRTKLGEAHGKCLRDYVHFVTKNWEDHTIVVDNTNTTTTEIAPYAALALAYKHDLEVIILDCDLEVAASRNVHGVPRAAVIRMAENIKRMQPHIPPYWNPRVVKV